MKLLQYSVLALALLVVGCVKRVPRTPAPSTLTLAGQTITHRAWGTVDDLCAVNRAQFIDEQQAMTALLAQWLGQTSAPADGAWDDEHLALLEEGARVLATPLDQQHTSLEQARVCRFEGLASAVELNAQARRRVEEAPELATQVRARLALSAWKSARPRLQAEAKEARCAPARKGARPTGPVPYFAAEDEHAAIEWLFCDGSKVVASPGNPPAWQPDPTARAPRKAPDPKAWLDAAAKFAPEAVSRAPRLPKKRLARENDDPEPN